MKIKCLRSDNGGEFTSSEFDMYYANKGIQRQLSIARTPQQNGVVERKNMTVIEMARSMLQDAKLDNKFWCQAVLATIHILNRSLLRTNNEKTPYELWIGILANLKYFRVFGSKCYIRQTDKNMGKFDSRTDEGIFLGYSCKQKAYRCFNHRLGKIVESVHVKVDESTTTTSIINQEESEDDEDSFSEPETVEEQNNEQLQIEDSQQQQ